MTCFICNKTYARLSQHLKRKHEFNNCVIEPVDIRCFALYLSLIPKGTGKLIEDNRSEIEKHFYKGGDLPTEVYKAVNKLLQAYMHQKGMKLQIKIAKAYKQPRKRKEKGALKQHNGEQREWLYLWRNLRGGQF